MTLQPGKVVPGPGMAARPLPLEVVTETGSTQDVLKQRAMSGDASEVALLALRQTAGRGRVGRRWESGAGNLHLSVLLRPSALRWPGHWSILSAVVLAEALRPFLGAAGRLRVKWPNDLLLDGGKLAGILIEAENGACPWLVVGFGVNLAHAPRVLDRHVACLPGPPPSPQVFARHLLAALHRWRARYAAEGFDPVRTAWLHAAHRSGDRLVAGAGTARTEGRFRGLGPDGSLLLDQEGTVVAVTAGELS